MRKNGSRLGRLGVLAPAALSACMHASVLGAPAAGAIVSTVLKELSKAFMLKNWFQGVMSSDEAEQLLLQKGKPGSYLVRESRRHPGVYVLSVRTRTSVSHVMIRREQNKYNVGSGEIFDDLTGLIEHCRAYPLTEISGEVLRLRQPVSGTRARTRHTTDKAIIMNRAGPSTETQPTQPETVLETPMSNIAQNLKVAGWSVQSEPTEPKQVLETQMHNIAQELQEIPTCHSQDYSEKFSSWFFKYMDDIWAEFSRIEALDKKGHILEFHKSIGNEPRNKYKNRYRDVVPYDETRVPLPRDSYSLDVENTDYINASYIRPDWMFDKIHRRNKKIKEMAKTHSSKFEDVMEMDNETPFDEDSTILRHQRQAAANVVKDKFYIAAQGCLDTTRHAFWTMLIDNDVRVIAMVTNCEEGVRIKCDKYWPDVGTTEILNNFTVTTVTENFHQYYAMRKLHVTYDKKLKVIYQYQISDWVDQFAPKSSDSILCLIKDVNERMRMVTMDEDPPRHNILCVHCSAGVGRTGTFIALDMLIDTAKINGIANMDPYKHVPMVVKLLRDQRPGMVSNIHQYKYIYTALDEYLTDAASAKHEKGPKVSY